MSGMEVNWRNNQKLMKEEENERERARRDDLCKVNKIYSFIQNRKLNKQLPKENIQIQ